MKISPINYNFNRTYSQKQNQISKNNGFVSSFYLDKTQKYPSFCKSTPNFNKRKEIFRYLATNPEPVAQGTDGIIYRHNNEAIKVAKTKETSFEAEAEILKKLPKELGTAQNFIDRFTYEGRDVLVSSFVDGTHKKSLENQDISKLFKVLLAHDKANIIHGDLNLGNIIFTKNGSISLIDYGSATQPETTKVELYPDFVINTNALKFENTGINDSMKAWSEDKQLENFREYLKQKADFYRKHAEFIATKYPEEKEAIEYEQNLAKVLAQPTDSIIETELRRITTLDLLENADTATNYDCNPHSAINLWNSTIDSVKDTIRQTQTQLSQTNLTEEERKYFEFQKKIAQTFYNTLSQWRRGTFEWLYLIKEPYFTPTSETEKRIKANWGDL